MGDFNGPYEELEVVRSAKDPAGIILFYISMNCVFEV